MNTEKTRFNVKMNYRCDFRDWLVENFPCIRRRRYDEYPDKLAPMIERIDEIVDACKVVEGILNISNSAYIDYYKNDWLKIDKTYREKDYVGFADALDSIVSGINVE